MRLTIASVLGFVTAALLAIASARSAPVVISFRTPTGNIGCVFSSGFSASDRPTVRCDIRSRLHPEPRRPKRCPLDYGDSIQVSRLGRAILVCHGDTAIDLRSPVLRYGHTWRRDGLSCTSRFDGLTCTNESRHGFFLSRQSF